MKPYYDDGQITIYHGDCRDVLPTLGPVDLVLTDPPYGINLPTDFEARRRGNLASALNYPPIVGDDSRFDPSNILALDVPTVLWGANYYAQSLPETSGWLVWFKRRGGIQNDQADAELAWTNIIKGVRVYQHEWNGFTRESERHEHYHPAQKPVALMRWVLEHKWIPAGLVLDPFMGSGTTLRAAKDLGRKAIGIEIEEKYCEIAAKRLAQEVLPLAFT